MEKKTVGRPKVPEYRKVKHRYSRIEDTFIKIIEQLESDKDRKLVLKALEQLKA